MEPKLSKNKENEKSNKIDFESDLILKLTYIDFSIGLIENYFGQ